MFIFTIFKGIRLLISTAVTLVVLVVALPYIAAVQPFRDGALRMVLPPVDGRVTSGGASLGWFSAERQDRGPPERSSHWPRWADSDPAG